MGIYMNGLPWRILQFVNILMHGREEWVLVQLGSRHKWIERPGWLMFPDYLSVSCGYG